MITIEEVYDEIAYHSKEAAKVPLTFANDYRPAVVFP